MDPPVDGAEKTGHYFLKARTKGLGGMADTPVLGRSPPSPTGFARL